MHSSAVLSSGAASAAAASASASAAAAALPQIGVEERQLLCSLIESAQYGPGVKALFDRQWFLRGEWALILQDSVAAKQGHIRDLCQAHYQEFLAGIEHLLAVKLDLSELRHLALTLNHAVQLSGRQVLEATRTLNETRRLRFQINATKQIVQSCSNLMSLIKKAKQQIYQTKYFSALKTLQQLQRILHTAVANYHRANPGVASAAEAAAAGGGAATGGVRSPTASAAAAAAAATTTKALSSAAAAAAATATSTAAAASAPAAASSAALRFEFLRQLERQIPLLTHQIKENVKAEFTLWINNIGKKSGQIGQVALQQLDDSLMRMEKQSSQIKKKAMAHRMLLMQQKKVAAAVQNAQTSAAIAAAAIAAAQAPSAADDKNARRAAKAAAAAAAAAAAELDEEEEEEAALAAEALEQEEAEAVAAAEESAGGGAQGMGGAGGGAYNSAALFETVPINFTPIYQCLHIYEHLNVAEQFQLLYKEKRLHQLMDSVHALAHLGNVGAMFGAKPNAMSPPAGGGGRTLAPPPAGSPRGTAGGNSQQQAFGNNPTSPASSRSSAAAATAAPSSPPASAAAPSDFIDQYTRVFASITGFFLIEDSILKSGNELMSRAEIDTLYEKVQLLLIQYLSHHLVSSPHFQSPSYFLQLKYALILLCKMMDESFLSLNSHILLSFLADQRPRFEAILLAKLAQDAKVIMSKEKWEPLAINDQTEYTLFILAFQLQDQSINVDFPCTMPFSISVPLIARVLTNFIEDYFMYARYLEDLGGGGGGGGGGTGAGGGKDGGSGAQGNGGSSSSNGNSRTNAVSSSWKAHIFRAVDRALSNEINRSYMELLAGSGGGGGGGGGGGASGESLPISQTVQISINAQSLAELAVPYLERYIEGYGEEDPSGKEELLGSSGLAAAGYHASSSSSSGAHGAPLSPSSSSASSSSGLSPCRHRLYSTKEHCEHVMFELLQHKIDMFLELSADFSWTPDAVSAQPSEYVVDCIAYLETMFHHMAFMPDAVREAMHFTSCKHLARHLLSPLSDAAPNAPCKKFNILAIANLNTDLHVLEAFAQRCPIQNLVETFAEIRQLLDLLLSGDVECLLDRKLKHARYPLLDDHKLIRILDKFKDLSLFAINTPPQFKKLKKKQVEAVVKALQKANNMNT